ncbi:aspartate kinase [Nostoc sp. 2RC]|uniref:amino acid kinase family protein n=1 Tax=Nostoc sp. 2RC TaxID=2485484 RepID=UPI0016273456|nr:aspartate kinase [Nostoc sp. 2RC]MBC1241051.1 aspartate kinase [Nostoc sp. 2RC]
MQIRVLKFGGSTFQRNADFNTIAAFLKSRLEADSNKLVVVVSAMAGLTDEFHKLALEVNTNPSPEALDSLLPLADTIGANLLRLAVEATGISVKVLSGYQLGIVTDSNFSHASIKKIDAAVLKQALTEVDIVVVPGGQAVDGHNRPTFLGRNSSDFTAVILAATLELASCEIFSDVNGIYSADPNLIANASLLETVSFDTAIDFSLSGAKVLHYKSVQVAKEKGVQILCRQNRYDYGIGTVIGEGKASKAAILDPRSIVLELASKRDLEIAKLKLQLANVPVILLPNEKVPMLVVTCGFFDAVKFLAESGIEAHRQDSVLISEFNGDSPVVRHIVSNSESIALCQTIHDRLYTKLSQSTIP